MLFEPEKGISMMRLSSYNQFMKSFPKCMENECFHHMKGKLSE
jgi:hypothetical protein